MSSQNQTTKSCDDKVIVISSKHIAGILFMLAIVSALVSMVVTATTIKNDVDVMKTDTLKLKEDVEVCMKDNTILQVKLENMGEKIDGIQSDVKDIRKVLIK